MKIDGEGVTSLIALIGCPLSCKYCINKNVTKCTKYQLVSKEKLLDRILIDYCYFVSTGGGVTFGGGEPLMQIDAILEFMEILPEGIGVNIETSLNYPVEESKLVKLINSVTSLIIDIKTCDDSIYEEYTGKKRDNLIKNIEIIRNLDMQSKCVIRIPNIPEYTTNEITDSYEDVMRNLGFDNIDRFDYVIRDEK